MKWLFLAVLMTLTLRHEAQAQRISNITGGKLGNICLGKSSASLEACDAYLDGVSDAVNFYQFLLPADGSRGGKLPDYFCVPGKATGPQLRETYVAWLRNHPDAQRQSAGQAAMRAFNDSYPCAGEQKKP